jgi:hypothetical protein
MEQIGGSMSSDGLQPIRFHPVAFVFPPFCESAYHGPHLAIPLLRAVLLEKGIASTALDLNLKVLYSLIEPERIGKVLELLPGSRLPQHTQRKARACLERLRFVGLERFTRPNPHSLKTALKFIREIVFPSPRRLEEALSADLVRTDLASELYDEFLVEVHGLRPDTVAFSVAFSEQLAEAIELARRIRASIPSARLLLGGSQVNLLDPQQISLIEDACLFDAISVGNGEQTIVQIISNSEVLATTDGTRKTRVWRSGSMTSDECNSLPIPLFGSTDGYLSPLTLPVLVTKGCYWGKCTFCDYPRLSDLGGRRFIQRSPNRVLKEIKKLQSTYSPEKINLISDAIPPSWYRQLAHSAIEEGVVLKTWSYMMHQGNLDREFFNLLAKAGVGQINFGTESTVDRLLELMKKQASFGVIRRNIEDAHSAGLTVVANAIVDYPTTTVEEAFDNIRGFEELLPFVDSVNPQMFDLTAGTPMAAQPSVFGLEVPKTAYVKTNHGFHALEYSRPHDLTETDRRIAQEAFFRLALRVKLRRRIDGVRLGSERMSNQIAFDGSAIILRDDNSLRVWIVSLGAEWPIEQWEADLLDRALQNASHSMTLNELRSSFHSTGPSSATTFEAWHSALIESGVVVQTSDSNLPYNSLVTE